MACDCKRRSQQTLPIGRNWPNRNQSCDQRIVRSGVTGALLSIRIHFLFQIINLFHVYDCHSHTKPATRLRSQTLGIAVKSQRERATDRSGCGWSYVIVREKSVDGHFKTVCDLSAITRRRYVLHGRTTNRVWSHHHSCVVAPPVVRDCVTSSRTISSSTSHKLFQLVARPNGDASHDLHLQSLANIGGTCKRAISNDWRRWKVWPIVVTG